MINSSSRIFAIWACFALFANQVRAGERVVPGSSFFMSSLSTLPGSGSYYLIVADLREGLVVLKDGELKLYGNQYRDKKLNLPTPSDFDRVLVRWGRRYWAFTLYSVHQTSPTYAQGFTTEGRDYPLLDPTDDSLGVLRGETYAEAMERANAALKGYPNFNQFRQEYEQVLWHPELEVDESRLGYRADVKGFMKEQKLIPKARNCDDEL